MWMDGTEIVLVICGSEIVLSFLSKLLEILLSGCNLVFFLWRRWPWLTRADEIFFWKFG